MIEILTEKIRDGELEASKKRSLREEGGCNQMDTGTNK